MVDYILMSFLNLATSQASLIIFVIVANVYRVKRRGMNTVPEITPKPPHDHTQLAVTTS